MNFKNLISNDKWLEACCHGIDFDLENRRTIYDFTAKSGAKFSGSFNVYNPKKNCVETVYIKQVIYHDPATVVFWSDGTKTVSKAVEGTDYDACDGLIYCIVKKLGNGFSLKQLFKEWLPDQENLLNDPIYVTLKDVRTNSK